MITGLIHKGSGLGDQLFSYIATRVRAVDLGVDFGFVGKEFFKGVSFMDLDWGKDTNLSYAVENPSGKVVVGEHSKSMTQQQNGMFVAEKTFVTNKPYYDPEFNFIEDGAVIDGYGAQDERYFSHHLNDIAQWLKVRPILADPNVCVINFRGGEFSAVPELFLPKDYWDKGIEIMFKKNPKMKFEVHTDDPNLAQQFFPDYPILADIGLNWRSIRYAKHLIVSNSAFAVIPALLGSGDVLAPRYWARRNIGQWSMPSNYYKKFSYI